MVSNMRTKTIVVLSALCAVGLMGQFIFLSHSYVSCNGDKKYSTVRETHNSSQEERLHRCSPPYSNITDLQKARPRENQIKQAFESSQFNPLSTLSYGRCCRRTETDCWDFSIDKSANVNYRIAVY